MCLLVVGAATTAVGCATKDVDSIEGVDTIDGVSGVDGTATADGTTAAEYGEGLTILRQDPKWGMSAVFKDEERAILIERRISAIKASAGEGEFEEDVMVTDAEGRVILLQQGGDSTVEPSWQKRIDADFALAPVDLQQRSADLARLERATKHLLVSPEVVLSTAARAAVKGMAVAARSPLYSVVDSDSTQETAYAPSTNTLQLWQSNIGIGNHSATWSNNSGTQVIKCNHGTGSGGCPNVGGMTRISGTLSKVADWYLWSCSTPYEVGSIDGGHNCHDDTVIQMRGWHWGGAPSKTSGPCKNEISHIWTPPLGYATGW